MLDVRHFGQLADGRSVEAITLGTAQGLQAEVLTYGAILRQLSFPVGGQRRNLILQLPSIEDYERDSAFLGPVVGRFANRIAAGKFAIDGQAHQLTCNEKGNHLHGGARGVGRRLWQLLEPPHRNSAGEGELRLELHSPAGEEGYPGSLDITLELTMLPDALRVSFTAHTDAPTPVNLTWHPYFNLGGSAAAHWLRIPASRYLPVGAGLIPTGEMAPVEGTPFDFRAERQIATSALHTHPQLSLGGGYDHCWVPDPDADCHCELRSPQRDVTLKVSASAPGLQFYSGQFLAQSHPGIGSGLALEPQELPDAPNHAAFPDAILRPGSSYHASIEYRVSATPPG